MYKEIQENFNKVIECSQGFYPNTDLLFSDWYKAKEKFIKLFNGELIVNCGEVSFALDKQTKDEKISEFLDSIDFEYHLHDLTAFIDEQREGFYNNEISKEYVYRNTKIPVGSKLVKSFKHFITNKTLLEEIQNRASMLIQDDKIHGELCFSVHPLDFLSLSETTYKWRSCHALDGEYRAGNLSYMCDSSTVICYLKAKDDKKLPNFPPDVKWNSKKWRCLLFFSESEQEIFYGRQYPMFSYDAMYQVLLDLWSKRIINKQGHIDEWVPPYKDFISEVPCELGGSFGLVDRYYPIRRKLYPIREIVKDKSELHFNDLLRSSCYNPYITVMDSWWTDNDAVPSFKIGSNIKCLYCGKDDIELTDRGTMLCPNCDDGEWDGRTYWCDYCGTSYDQDEMSFIDGLAICPDCLPEKTGECVRCGRLHLKDHSFMSEDQQRYCSRVCYEEDKKNGKRTDSQEQSSREIEGNLRIELPW